MTRRQTSIAIVLILAGAAPTAAQDQQLTYYKNAVKVKRGDLVHTSQLFPRQSQRGAEAADEVLDQLKGICQSNRATLSSVAKVNLYYDDADAKFVSDFQMRLNQAWTRLNRPAITAIPTPLPGGAKAALDAVIAAPSETSNKRREQNAARAPSDRDILYVSGRAAKGSLAEATAGTMKELFAVLNHFKAERRDVVQVKAFIKPMRDWRVVEKEITTSFGKVAPPPIIYVQWESKSRATEIELIAAAPDRAATRETVSYATPPGDRASPVFSRVARLHADSVIYIGGRAGADGKSADAEVRSLYQDVSAIARAAGADLRHFAKATYYVSDDQVSAALNRLRPEFYDPKRPPAASKVQVVSIGTDDRGLLMDMIAAPVRPPN